MCLTINTEEDADLTAAAAAVEKLSNDALIATEIVIKIPLRHINYGSWLTDITLGHLQIVYVAEELARISNNEVSYCYTGSRVEQILEFKFKPSNADAFRALLVETLIPHWQGEDTGIMDIAYEYHNTIVTNPSSLVFPELADDYLGNHVLSLDEFSDEHADADCESEDSGWPLLASRKPEWEHHVFQSCQAAKAGILAYIAVDIESQIGHLLLCDEGNQLESFLRAFNIVPRISNSSMIIDPRLRCQLDVFSSDRPALDIGNKLIFWSNDGLFEMEAREIAILQERAWSVLSEKQKSLLDLSDVRVCAASGAVAIVYSNVTLIGWGFRCRPDSYTGIVKILEMAGHETIDWAQITADDFEAICYDYCEYLGYYSVRKIGKTKSRDGGRDLVAKKATKKTHRVPRKWIVQCKLSRKEASVTADTLGSISDICHQYDARGYTVITNGHIDATLHDRLDALEQRGVIDDYEVLSKQEVERYLLRNPAAMQKYFGGVLAGGAGGGQ